jgi:hypothetical protein
MNLNKENLNQLQKEDSNNALFSAMMSTNGYMV